MINEFKAFFQAFKLGKSIKDATKAKQFQNAGNLTGQLFVTLAVISQAFGYHIPVSDEDLLKLGASLGTFYFIGNYVVTMISSDKVGFK